MNLPRDGGCVGNLNALLAASLQLARVKRTTEFTQSVLREIPQQTVKSVDSHRSSDQPPEVKSVKSARTKLEVKKTIFTPKLSAVIPYIEIAGVNHQYTEHGQQWMRLDFAYAQKLCRKVAMSLPSKAQWSELMQARPFVNDAWPPRIPYWGSVFTHSILMRQSNR